MKCSWRVATRRRDQVDIALQIHEPYVGPVADDDGAVAALERRTSNHDMGASEPRLIDEVGDGDEPRRAIFVSQRDAGVHFVDVAGRVKPVAVLEIPTQRQRKLTADSGLSASRNPHDHEYRRRHRGLDQTDPLLRNHLHVRLRHIHIQTPLTALMRSAAIAAHSAKTDAAPRPARRCPLCRCTDRVRPPRARL